MAARQLLTKYSGTCLCGAPVAAGMTVLYDAATKPAIRSCAACNGELPGGVAAPIQVELKVVIQRVRNEGNDGWAKVDATLDAETENIERLPVQGSQPFTAVGLLGKVSPGDLMEAHGVFEFHPKFGLQFKVNAAVRVVGGSLQSLEAFLTELPNIGEKRARAIIRHFRQSKAEVLDAIENHPLRLTGVQGITEERALEIQKAYKEQDGELRDTAIWLAGLQLGEETTALVIRSWKGKAKARLLENPYQLMELRGIGFKRADELALSRFAIHPHDPRRAAAAVLFLLQEEEDDGHTYTLLPELIGYPPVEGI